MNDHTRRADIQPSAPLASRSVQAEEACPVAEHVHPAIGDDWRDVYRRAEIELRLHLAANRIDADKLAGVRSKPKTAAG